MVPAKLAQDEEGRAFALRDGRRMSIGRLVAADEGPLRDFVSNLSEEDIYFRFLTTGIAKEVLLRELSPKPECYALVAKDGDKIGAHAVFYRSSGEPAEIGVLVLEGYQGEGLGTRMIEMLAREANDEGISAFEAVIGWNNTRMIRLVRTMGFPTSEKVEPDLIRIRFPTSIDPVSIEEFQERWVFGPG